MVSLTQESWRKLLGRCCALVEGEAPVKTLEGLTTKTRAQCGGRVVSGPFKGLLYGQSSFGSVYLPKLLGTYERELSAYFTPQHLSRYGAFANLGCAEGYYTNGIAFVLKERLRRPRALVLGVDLDEEALVESKRIAAANDLNVEVTTKCDWAVLTKQPGKSLAICDVEGAEAELLIPASLPSLRRTDFIVEVHDDPGQRAVRDALLERFAPTHERAEILSQARRVADFPSELLFAVAAEAKLEAMNERRVKGLCWLVLRAKE